MNFALWYNQALDAWYLLDWTKVVHDKHVILCPWNVANCSTSDKPFCHLSGGFSWAECGSVLLFDKYPSREIATIKKANKEYTNVKPHLLRK